MTARERCGPGGRSFLWRKRWDRVWGEVIDWSLRYLDSSGADKLSATAARKAAALARMAHFLAGAGAS